MRGLTLNKLSFARGENVHLLHDTKLVLVVRYLCYEQEEFSRNVES